MMIKKNHPFHLVDQSPWPLLGSISAMMLTSGMAIWFNINNMNMFYLGLLALILTAIQWWRDVIRESALQGIHTNKVLKSMKWGMILFITSEVFFFLSFFWGFFHSSLSPSMEIGMTWPPLGINTFNAMQIPLLNTIILLSSGFTVTWAHHALMENNQKVVNSSLFITVVMGIYFSSLQAMEYNEASFSIADSVYGASFFMATGFHGIHVLIGTMFLTICLGRNMKNHFSKNHHFGFEAAAWYWHFVDIVWLFLYMNLYWWGA
uniref:Cytochrome c oxidase subunit 3 n=1 Tax=Sminthurinus signatus TaxID=2584529 RepID=A0A6H0EYZ3_9HEXA|nr:cytochrome c oxidase subunit 3 [Sminthurinus signatus]